MHILGGGRSGPSGMAAAGQEPPGCHFSLDLHDLRWRPEPPPTDENWRRFGHTATLVPEWPTYTLPGLYRIVPADDDADSLRMDAMQLQDPPEAGTDATPPWRGAAVVVIGGAAGRNEVGQIVVHSSTEVLNSHTMTLTSGPMMARAR